MADFSTIRCNDPVLSSARIQRQIILRLLCYLANYLDSRECGDEAALVVLAEAEGLLCKRVEQLRLLQAQLVCESSVMNLDCSATICLTELEQEAVITYLLGQILDVVETPV